MNTEETTAPAEAQLCPQTTAEPSPAPAFTPKPPSVDDFHPTVQAINRIKTVGQAFAKRTEVEADLSELVNIAGSLMAELAENDPMEASLRKQSALIDAAFTTLLLKATRDDKFDEDSFDAALRSQRQYRMTCQILSKLKKEREQTDMKALKDYEAHNPYRRASDQFTRT